jgi:hypothetical protein
MDGNMIGGPVEPGKPTSPTPVHPKPNEQDDFEVASESAVDLDQFMPQLKQKHTARKVVVWIVIVLLVLAAGAGAYYALGRKSPSKANTNAKQQSSQSKSQSAITTSTTNYSSSNFNLSFNYPQGWNVSDPGNGKLTVSSPTMQLTAASGQSQSGQVVMTIQNESSANFGMFSQGNAVAVLGSQHVNYSNPTQTQRASTYVSFLQYATTTAHGGLDGVYVTGDSGYQAGQSIPEVDITKVDPVITVTFNQCSTTTCGSPKALTIDSNMWSDSSFSGPIMKMIESLAIQ